MTIDSCAMGGDTLNLKECYTRMNCDYEAAVEQFQADKLIEKYMLKFPGEKTMEALREAVKSGDIEASFAASHTLKGLAANLAFKCLYDSAYALTEQLRPKTAPADRDLFSKVEQCYSLIISTIKQYEAEM